MLDYQSNPGSM